MSLHVLTPAFPARVASDRVCKFSFGGRVEPCRLHLGRRRGTKGQDCTRVSLQPSAAGLAVARLGVGPYGSSRYSFSVRRWPARARRMKEDNERSYRSAFLGRFSHHPFSRQAWSTRAGRQEMGRASRREKG